MKKVYFTLASLSLAYLSACSPTPIDPPMDLKHKREPADLSKVDASGSAYGKDLASIWQKSTGQEKDGARVTVALVGTGIDYTNPDLKDALWMNTGELGDTSATDHLDNDKNEYEDDVIGYDMYDVDGVPYDWHGHDTYLASIIAASGRTNHGVVGVAPNAQIMTIRYLGADGKGFDPKWAALDAVSAIEYAIANKARVMLFTWPQGGFHPRVAGLVTTALEATAAANMLVVIPAGNETNRTLPAFLNTERILKMNNVIIVAGGTPEGNLTPMTNRGQKYATMAAVGTVSRGFFPGGVIEAGGLQSSDVAAAYVTGVAALMATLPGYGAAKDLRTALMKNVSSNNLDVLTGGSMNLSFLATK